MAEQKPVVERANVWVSVFAAVVALIVGATQQRPASSVALAVERRAKVTHTTG